MENRRTEKKRMSIRRPMVDIGLSCSTTQRKRGMKRTTQTLSDGDEVVIHWHSKNRRKEGWIRGGRRPRMKEVYGGGSRNDGKQAD